MNNGGSLPLSDEQLGRKALEAIATIVKPDTILRWHAKLVAWFDGTSYRKSHRTTASSPEIEAQILRFARENRNFRI